MNMAVHQSCQIALQTSLLIVSCMFQFHATMTGADTALVDRICKQAQSSEFCWSIFNADLRTTSARADLHGLAIISIDAAISQIRDTIDDIIPEIIKKQQANTNIDPVERQRMEECEWDYKGALEDFLGAFQSSSGKKYWEVIEWVREGANQAIHCEDVYRWTDPVTVCPISAQNHNVVKLAEIIFIVLQSLLPFF